MKTVFGAAARGTTNRTICVRPTATTIALLTATTITAFVLSSTPSVRITLITVWVSAYKVPMSLLLVVIKDIATNSLYTEVKAWASSHSESPSFILLKPFRWYKTVMK